MAITRDLSGTQTAVISTEHVLGSPTSAAYYQLVVDLVNMTAGDRLELRIKVPALNAGTKRTVFYAVYSGELIGDDNKMAISPPVPVVDASDFTLKQTAGTGRNFPWAIIKAA